MRKFSLMQRVITLVFGCGRFSKGFPRALAFLMLCASLALPATSHAAAACSDFSITVAVNGSKTIDASTCDTDGFGLGGIVTPPTSGTASVDNSNDTVTYTNTQNASSDHFVFSDDRGNPINVTVTITAAASPITITPASLPAPVFRQAYTQSLSA